jgi:HAD superfamily phosphoserine phosphatase-like hydrolase
MVYSVNKNCVSFFDFDSTLYKGKKYYLIFDFPEFLYSLDLFNPREIPRLDALRNSYNEGFIDRNEFTVEVIDAYYTGLAGQSATKIKQAAQLFWETQFDQKWFPHTIPLLKLMKTKTTLILVSGSPIEVLRIIYKKLGFTHLYATQGYVRKGVYTGKYNKCKEMATSEAKQRLVTSLMQSGTIDPKMSFAFGDSESDFPLFAAVHPQNVFLIGPNTETLTSVTSMEWNIYQYDDQIIDGVKDRIGKVFSPQSF